MNTFFLVPKDVKSVVGTYLTVSHYIDHFKRIGNVTVLEIPYHVDNTIVDLRRQITEYANNTPCYIIGFTLNICYIMLRHLKVHHFANCVCACFLIDSMTLNVTSIIKHEIIGKSFFSHLLRLPIYTAKESFCLKKCSKIIYVSPVDRDYVSKRFSSVKKGRIYAIPNAIDIPYRKERALHFTKRAFTIGTFTGFSEETVNNNLLPFLNCFLPEIVKEIPTIQFVVAGRGAKKSLIEDLNRRNNVKYIGEVDELDDFYDRVDAVIITVKKECGIITRIMEAWAYKKVVIGFRRNFAAYEKAEINKHYYAADDASEFITTLKMIIESPQIKESVQEAAYQLVKKYYSWESRGPQLQRILTEG